MIKVGKPRLILGLASHLLKKGEDIDMIICKLGLNMKYRTDFKNLKKETEVFRFGASTKGGQRANRKETGIRLRHLPSGIEIKVIEERSQARNLEIAFDRLQKRLRKMNRPKKKRIPTKIPFRAKLKRLRKKKVRAEKKKLRRGIEI